MGRVRFSSQRLPSHHAAPTLGLFLPFPCHLAQGLGIPRKAFGMVILSHMRSRTSSPDSGAAMALVTEAMSMWMERPRLSQPDRGDNRELRKIHSKREMGRGSRLTIRQGGAGCDRAHRRRAWVSREGASQCSRVRHPGSRINWLDGLIWNKNKIITKIITTQS